MRKLSLLSSIFVITLFLASCGTSEGETKGTSSKAVDPVTSTDGDGDGVADLNADGSKLDKCPLEGFTTDVNGDGCEDSTTDTDGDNVNGVGADGSANDKCPFAGFTSDVNGDGCEDSTTDTDNDGVNGVTNGIANDKCPFDGFDTDVNQDGCDDSTTDSDGDNVNGVGADGSANDKCPFAGFTSDVNGDGCDDSTTDSDNDGINGVGADGSANDKCPFAGFTTDANQDGCEDSTTDTDGDTVLDDSDRCITSQNTNFVSSDTNDRDSDGCEDVGEDKDDDDNGLIEIATADELDNVRHDLDGTHYDEDDDDSTNNIGSNAGCPTSGCNGYELAGDIDLSSITNFVPIGPSGSPFTAVFEGNGNTISNLIISNDTRYVGFFGILGASSEVRNLSFAKSATDTGSVTSRNISISTEIGSVGTLAGENRGTISGVSTALSVSVDLDTSVTGPKYVGGLVGESTSIGTIQNSSATGNVSGGSGNDKSGWLDGIRSCNEQLLLHRHC